MELYFSIFIAGFLGGVLRGAVGLVKYSTAYKDVDMRPGYFAITIGLSGLVGLLAAYVTADLGITFLGLESVPFSLAIVLGYAGGDLLENIYKIAIKSPTIYSIK